MSATVFRIPREPEQIHDSFMDLECFVDELNQGFMSDGFGGMVCRCHGLPAVYGTYVLEIQEEMPFDARFCQVTTRTFLVCIAKSVLDQSHKEKYGRVKSAVTKQLEPVPGKVQP